MNKPYHELLIKLRKSDKLYNAFFSGVLTDEQLKFAIAYIQNRTKNGG